MENLAHKLQEEIKELEAAIKHRTVLLQHLRAICQHDYKHQGDTPYHKRLKCVKCGDIYIE